MRKLTSIALLTLIAIGCGSSDPPAPGGSGGTGGAGGTGGVSGMGGTGGNDNACVPGGAFNPGASPAMVNAIDLCDRLAVVQCAAERCCCPDGNARKYESEAACVTAQSALCVDLSTEVVAQDPRAGFNPSTAASAFIEFERRASACDLTITSWGTSRDGFASALAGTVALGGACWRPLTDGEDGAAIASCGSVNACVGDGTSVIMDPEWTCGPRRGVGGRCLVDPTCEEHLFCDPLPSAQNIVLGTCKERRAIGGDCDRPTQCASLYCVGGKCVEPSREAAYCLKQ